MIWWVENWPDRWAQKVVIASTKSNWQMVISGVPQVVILGAILFNIFINNLDDRIESILRKNVDNMTLGRVVNILEGRTAIQMDSWTGTSKLNKGKCKVLHSR